MKIFPIPALSDNYIWVVEKEKQVIVVDPSEASPLLERMEKNGDELCVILLTHKHPDHTGGVKELVRTHPAPVYGPKETGLCSEIVKGGETLSLLGEKIRVVATPGHTEGHVAYLMDRHAFVGDTLFLSSCGRVFSGDYRAMFESLRMLKTWDDGTLVYPAHEYSLSNLEQTVKDYPGDAVREELERVRQLRERGEVTLPTTIGKEKKVNPFMMIEDFETFKEYRIWRDRS